MAHETDRVWHGGLDRLRGAIYCTWGGLDDESSFYRGLALNLVQNGMAPRDGSGHITQPVAVPNAVSDISRLAKRLNKQASALIQQQPRHFDLSVHPVNPARRWCRLLLEPFKGLSSYKTVMSPPQLHALAAAAWPQRGGSPQDRFCRAVADHLIDYALEVVPAQQQQQHQQAAVEDGAVLSLPPPRHLVGTAIEEGSLEDEEEPTAAEAAELAAAADDDDDGGSTGCESGSEEDNDGDGDGQQRQQGGPKPVRMAPRRERPLVVRQAQAVLMTKAVAGVSAIAKELGVKPRALLEGCDPPRCFEVVVEGTVATIRLNLRNLSMRASLGVTRPLSRVQQWQNKQQQQHTPAPTAAAATVPKANAGGGAAVKAAAGAQPSSRGQSPLLPLPVPARGTAGAKGMTQPGPAAKATTPGLAAKAAYPVATATATATAPVAAAGTAGAAEPRQLQRQGSAASASSAAASPGAPPAGAPAVVVVSKTRDCARVHAAIGSLPESGQGGGGRQRQRVVAVDCRGSVGKTGQLCLVQVYVPPPVHVCFAYNLVGEAPPGLTTSLGEILGDASVTKVLHDCRQDAAALLYQAGVRVENVLDTQVMYAMLEGAKAGSSNSNGSDAPMARPSLQTLLEVYGLQANQGKNGKGAQPASEGPEVWARRPLPARLLATAAAEVAQLVPLAQALLQDLRGAAAEVAGGSPPGGGPSLRDEEAYARSARQAQWFFEEEDRVQGKGEQGQQQKQGVQQQEQQQQEQQQQGVQQQDVQQQQWRVPSRAELLEQRKALASSVGNGVEDSPAAEAPPSSSPPLSTDLLMAFEEEWEEEDGSGGWGGSGAAAARIIAVRPTYRPVTLQELKAAIADATGVVEPTIAATAAAVVDTAAATTNAATPAVESAAGDVAAGGVAQAAHAEGEPQDEDNEGGGAIMDGAVEAEGKDRQAEEKEQQALEKKGKELVHQGKQQDDAGVRQRWAALNRASFTLGRDQGIQAHPQFLLDLHTLNLTARHLEEKEAQQQQQEGEEEDEQRGFGSLTLIQLQEAEKKALELEEAVQQKEEEGPKEEEKEFDKALEEEQKKKQEQELVNKSERSKQDPDEGEWAEDTVVRQQGVGYSDYSISYLLSVLPHKMAKAVVSRLLTRYRLLHDAPRQEEEEGGSSARGGGGQRLRTWLPPLLAEVVVDMGRDVVLRYADGHEEYLEGTQVNMDDALRALQVQDGAFPEDDRLGISGTLHRISAVRSKTNRVIGLTYRVGRHWPGTASLIRDVLASIATSCGSALPPAAAAASSTLPWQPLPLSSSLSASSSPSPSFLFPPCDPVLDLHDVPLSGQSLLILGPPGVGKTTLLRDVARMLTGPGFGLHVAVVDTRDEIAGAGDVPHPCIGRARRFSVPQGRDQAEVLLSVVHNHTPPQVLVVDEICTSRDAGAVKVNMEKGVVIIGTAHGSDLSSLLRNPDLAALVGGEQDTASRRKKTRLERRGPPLFGTLLEMQTGGTWRLHTNVARSVDALLSGQAPAVQLRRAEAGGEVMVARFEPGG